MSHKTPFYMLCVGLAFFAVPLALSDRAGNFEALLKSPRVRAFLDSIAYAEGTLEQNGYRMLYGGEYFDDFADHPRTVIKSKRYNTDLASSAAGRYQILERIWDNLADKLNAQDFSPLNQDRAALALIDSASALGDILADRPEKAWRKVAHIWSSLPTSPYDQCRVSEKQLKKVYRERLQKYA